MKKLQVSVLGDSISTLEGCNPPGFLAYYSSQYLKEEDTWWKKVIEAMNGELLVNNSFSGSTAASASAKEATFPSGGSTGRIALDKDGEIPDVILIYLGINDSVYFSQLDDEKHSLNTFYGGYLNMLKELKRKYPDALIIGIAPYNLKEIDDLIVKACENRGCASLVLDKPYETMDGYHPTVKGMDQMAETILNLIKKDSKLKALLNA